MAEWKVWMMEISKKIAKTCLFQLKNFGTETEKKNSFTNL